MGEVRVWHHTIHYMYSTWYGHELVLQWFLTLRCAGIHSERASEHGKLEVQLPFLPFPTVSFRLRSLYSLPLECM
jgi:hypothetical protein